MKKLTKRILSVFLIALLVCTLLPMGAFAEEVAEPQTEEVSEQKVVVVDAVAERGLVSGEKQTCRFKILYVDSSYNLGYNYGRSSAGRRKQMQIPEFSTPTPAIPLPRLHTPST